MFVGLRQQLSAELDPLVPAWMTLSHCVKTVTVYFDRGSSPEGGREGGHVVIANNALTQRRESTACMLNGNDVFTSALPMNVERDGVRGNV